jgi:tetratricopeptide (TPR) repeat protein
MGDVTKARELLQSAKDYAKTNREALSQIELSEASLYAQEKKLDLACERFAAVKSEYQDILAHPDGWNFALELNSRLACALVDGGRYDEAVPIFREIFKRGELEDKQRLQVYFGVALIRSGDAGEAQSLLFEAARGANAQLCQTALKYLSKIKTTQ